MTNYFVESFVVNFYCLKKPSTQVTTRRFQHLLIALSLPCYLLLITILQKKWQEKKGKNGKKSNKSKKFKKILSAQKALNTSDNKKIPASSNSSLPPALTDRASLNWFSTRKRNFIYCLTFIFGMLVFLHRTILKHKVCWTDKFTH